MIVFQRSVLAWGLGGFVGYTLGPKERPISSAILGAILIGSIGDKALEMQRERDEALALADHLARAKG